METKTITIHFDENAPNERKVLKFLHELFFVNGVYSPEFIFQTITQEEFTEEQTAIVEKAKEVMRMEKTEKKLLAEITVLIKDFENTIEENFIANSSIRFEF